VGESEERSPSVELMAAFSRFARLLRLSGGRPLAPRDGYALWADSYPPSAHNPLMEIEQSAVAPLLAASCVRPGQHGLRRALDVGTGTGRYLPLLEEAGARVIVGLDLSMPMLGKNTSARPRVCGDACRLPFPDRTFDLVCSSLMAGDVEDLAGWVGEAARVLAPGGHLVYSDFHPSWKAARWRRTFRTAGGQLAELSYFPHSLNEHLSLLERAPLEVRTIREPRLKGVAHPVVVVFHAVKAPGAPAEAGFGRR
jgi:malonyl-CoA O-methyltransferase